MFGISKLTRLRFYFLACIQGVNVPPKKLDQHCYEHGQRHSILQKKSKSRFFSLSSISQPINHWLAQAAYREKLGLAYAHTFFLEHGVMLNVVNSYEW